MTDWEIIIVNEYQIKITESTKLKKAAGDL